MGNEIVSIMEKIEKDTDKLKHILEINETDEMYRFFRENGYRQSFEKFQEEIINFLQSSKIKPEQDSNFENVAGGINIKNKLKKATSVGLASLMAAGAPMGHASTSTAPRKSTSSFDNLLNSSLAKKMLTIAGISFGGVMVSGAGIGSILGINWLYKKYRNKRLINKVINKEKIDEIDKPIKVKRTFQNPKAQMIYDALLQSEPILPELAEAALKAREVGDESTACEIEEIVFTAAELIKVLYKDIESEVITQSVLQRRNELSSKVHRGQRLAKEFHEAQETKAKAECAARELERKERVSQEKNENAVRATLTDVDRMLSQLVKESLHTRGTDEEPISREIDRVIETIHGLKSLLVKDLKSEVTVITLETRQKLVGELVKGRQLIKKLHEVQEAKAKREAFIPELEKVALKTKENRAKMIQEIFPKRDKIIQKLNSERFITIENKERKIGVDEILNRISELPDELTNSSQEAKEERAAYELSEMNRMIRESEEIERTTHELVEVLHKDLRFGVTEKTSRKHKELSAKLHRGIELKKELKEQIIKMDEARVAQLADRIDATECEIRNFLGSEKILEKLGYDTLKGRKITDITKKLFTILGHTPSEKDFGLSRHSVSKNNSDADPIDSFMGILCQYLIWGYLYNGDQNKWPNLVDFSLYGTGVEHLNRAVIALAFIQTETEEYKPDKQRLRKVIKCIEVLQKELLPLTLKGPVKNCICNKPYYLDIIMGLQEIAVDESEFDWSKVQGNGVSYNGKVINGFLEFVGAIYSEFTAKGYRSEDLNRLRIKYGDQNLTLKKYFELVCTDPNLSEQWRCLGMGMDNMFLNIDLINQGVIKDEIYTYQFRYITDESYVFFPGDYPQQCPNEYSKLYSIGNYSTLNLLRTYSVRHLPKFF